MNKKTNAVAFGEYAILLERDQLSYYSKGELFRVKDVNHEYTPDDLFNHATDLAEKKNIANVMYIDKTQIKTAFKNIH